MIGIDIAADLSAMILLIQMRIFVLLDVFVWFSYDRGKETADRFRTKLMVLWLDRYCQIKSSMVRP